MFKLTRKTRQEDRNGIAATEFAVCLPVLMLILMGVLETCSMIFLKQSLAVAAYEGAHTAVQAEATAADVIATCNSILADRGVNGANVVVTPNDLSSIDPGEYIRVEVNAPTAANRVAPVNVLGNQTLRSEAVFVKEI